MKRRVNQRDASRLKKKERKKEEKKEKIGLHVSALINATFLIGGIC